MDNAAEPYDLIAVLWHLEGFKRIEGEISQHQSNLSSGPPRIPGGWVVCKS